MAQTLATPTVSVRPAGAGTISLVTGSSGSFSPSVHQSSAFQNYTYIATPATGYHFSHFELTAVYKQTRTESGQTTETSYTATANINGNPFFHTSNLRTNGTISDTTGGVYWWVDDYGWYSANGWIDSVSVVAVFTPATGQLVYSSRQGGQLVYSAAQGGALVYDG